MPPSPQRVLDVTDWQWHHCGLDGARRRALRAVASVASRLEPEVAGDSAGAAAAAVLDPRHRRVDGGRGGAAGARLPRHGQRRRLPPEEHRGLVAGRARNTDDAEMLELLEPWRGHRQRVVRLLLAGGLAAAARGPRFAPTNYRRI